MTATPASDLTHAEGPWARPSRALWSSAVVAVALALWPACLFAPQLEEHGYTPCSDDEECAAGRRCQVGVCAPPPWFDELYGERRLLVVENRSSEEVLQPGTAVPLVIGEGGLLPIEALGAEGRFLTYDAAEDPGDVPGAGWKDLPIHRVLLADRLLAWVPVPASVSPGDEAALAWIYTGRDDQEALLLVDPPSVFERYDDFATAGLGLDATRYRVDGTGDVTLTDGRILLNDATQLFVLDTLEAPFVITFGGRINGVLCDALFMGVQGDDFVGSVPPYSGFFFREGLELALDVVPTADSQPGALSFQDIEDPLAFHRYSIEVNDGRTRLLIDDVAVVERADLVPPLAEGPFFATIDVDGECAFELESLWVTRPTFTAPVVRAEEPVIR